MSSDSQRKQALSCRILSLCRELCRNLPTFVVYLEPCGESEDQLVYPVLIFGNLVKISEFL